MKNGNLSVSPPKDRNKLGGSGDEVDGVEVGYTMFCCETFQIQWYFVETVKMHRFGLIVGRQHL